MKPRHYLVLILVLLPSLVIGSALLAPTMVLVPLANLLLADTGIHVVSLQSVRPGWRRSNVAALTLNLPGMQTELAGVSITYRAGELLRGRIVSVHIDRIEIISQAMETADNNADQSLEEMLSPLSSLPFTRAEIDELRFHGTTEVLANVSMTTSPLLLESRLATPAFDTWGLALTLQAFSANEFTGSARLVTDTEEVLGSDFDLAVLGDTLVLAVESELHLAPLLSLPAMARHLSGLEIDTKTLFVNSSLRFQRLPTEPSLAALTVSLDSPEPSLQARWQAQETNVEARISLPLQVQGSAGSLWGDLSVTMQGIQGNLNVDSDAASFQGNIQAQELQLLCPDPMTCNLDMSTNLALQHWETGTINGRDARLSGPLGLAFGSDTVQLHSPLLTLSLPEIQAPELRGASTLEFSELSADLTQGPSLQFNVASSQLDPGIANLTLTNPQLAGQIRLNAESLSAELELSLDNRLQATLQLDQVLTDGAPGAGRAAMTLQEYIFTDTFNLASLVAYADTDADLVAGSLGGQATLRWQPSEDGSWQLNGPLTLRLDALSGTLLDSFFVGLDTELHARFGSGPRLYTDNLQEAGLVTLDVGLPLNNITWRYGFDTATGLITVQEAHTELLGGSVEIADFRYDNNAEQNRLDVALVELDLATIVALANYPNLQVSGTISGYIPLLLDQDGVTIEQGLVSALNPGGSIRYTPANSASANATMQLVNRALANYQYDHFDAEISYSEAGDMEAAVRLRGMNPDLQDGRRINVNVNISDNIPALLRSLQTSRVITESLEQRLNRQ